MWCACRYSKDCTDKHFTYICIELLSQRVEESYKDEDGNYSETKHLMAVKERDNSTWQSSWGPVGFEKSTHPLMMMVITLLLLVIKPLRVLCFFHH